MAAPAVWETRRKPCPGALPCAPYCVVLCRTDFTLWRLRHQAARAVVLLVPAG